jgi:DNA primase
MGMKKKSLIIDLVDVEEYLDALDIEYSHPGSKNTGQNSISIQCPWCDDGSYHLGIELDRKFFNCWKCTKSGSLIKLAMKLEDCPYHAAVEHLQEFMTASTISEGDNDSQVTQSVREVELVGVNTLLEPHQKYLESRNFDPEYIFQKYSLNCVGPIGRWSHSLIIPYLKNGRVITFCAADITRTSDKKYKYLPNELSIVPIGQTLYNIDRAIDTALVVEGATDTWRMGDGAVGLGRKKYTSWQVKRLAKFKRVFIMLDSDATEMATDLANDVGMFTEVVLLELESGDPADLSNDDVKEIRKDIF